jgi:hypothetical protein
MKPIFIAPRSMKFKSVDKILFLVLFLLIITFYAAWYISVRRNTVESANHAKHFFYSTAIHDTVKFISPIYKDTCNTSFEIANYPMHDIVVDLCKYSTLRKVKMGDFLQKDKNSKECIITGEDGRQIRLNFEIEY